MFFKNILTEKQPFFIFNSISYCIVVFLYIFCYYGELSYNQNINKVWKSLNILGFKIKLSSKKIIIIILIFLLTHILKSYLNSDMFSYILIDPKKRNELNINTASF